MKIEHTIDKVKNTVTVDVSLSVCLDGKKERITTPDIEKYLKTQKIKIGECVKKDVANNLSKHPSGKWIFILDKPTRKVVQSKDESSKLPRKITRRSASPAVKDSKEEEA